MTAHLNPAPWIDNIGAVLDGVEADTSVDVEYLCGGFATWIPAECGPNDDPKLWELDGGGLDVIRWRKVQL